MAECLLFRIGLTAITSLYDGATFFDNDAARKEQLESFDKRILDRLLVDTAKKADMRTNLGNDVDVWEGLQFFIHTLVAFLDVQIFEANMAAEPGEPEVVSCPLVVLHSDDLVDTLLRVEKSLKIARNSLVAGHSAQDTAIDAGMDKALFRLITLCIRVAGKGYDEEEMGDEREGDEEAFKNVLEMFKRVLTMALQVMNNLIVTNEKRKTMIWISLFDDVPPLDLKKEYEPLYKMPQSATEKDFVALVNPDWGEILLEKGKAELLKKLEPIVKNESREKYTKDVPVPPSTVSKGHPGALRANTLKMNKIFPEDDELMDDDYFAIGDHTRGILTDIPLVLGPGEIEVLPMILQTGIVTPGEGISVEANSITKIHNTRAQLLITRENGRNLLRELLIFIAAWDLREDELYVKIMMRIVSALLTSGLLTRTYQAFREPKDIISPAQAVILKLLANIFRTRQKDDLEYPPSESELKYPLTTEVELVKYLLKEFRRSVVPQVAAIIFCQGQISKGHAFSEDFPLNLWDMERMYEGTYQFLELFVTLCDHPVWKRLLSDYFISTELTCLLEELNASIPRSTASGLKSAELPDALVSVTGAVLSPKDSTWDSAPGQSGSRVSTVPAVIPKNPSDNYPSPLTRSDIEPSQFEWRNLKKLTVLLLSSLVWQNPKVQAQLGRPDKDNQPGRGLRALLMSTQMDDYNPYIREHALLAIRFAVDGCRENVEIFREFTSKNRPQTPAGNDKSGKKQEKSGAQDDDEQPDLVGKLKELKIPKEILESTGVEMFLDDKGVTQYRRIA
jgi:palmitoyltransferase